MRDFTARKFFPTWLALAPLALVASTAIASAQSLSTDANDYLPGAEAVLTGAGFAPNEAVTLIVLHADGHASTGEDHLPWTISADGNGDIATTWHVCEDDCVGAVLIATADGAASGAHAEALFTDSGAPCGAGVVTSITGLAGACVLLDPANGGGPDSWNVVQGGSYSMTISGVTDCSQQSTSIKVFVQGGNTGNFCFIANRVPSTNNFIGTFTMPNPACFTYPISYKCGDGGACNNSNTVDARGPYSGCGGVHLRAGVFDSSCHYLHQDENCNSNPPTIVCPPDQPAACSTGGGSNVTFTGTPTVSGGTPPYTITYSPPSGSFFPLGINPVTVNVTDSSSPPQSDQCSFNVVVTGCEPCSNPPHITCPGNLPLECGSDNGAAIAAWLNSATATDGCSIPTITNDFHGLAGGCGGNTGWALVTFTATDDQGNHSSCQATVTVVDATGPTLSGVPTSTSADCASVPAAATVTASDDCSGVNAAGVVLSETTTAGNCAGNYTIHRMWSATDNCGNTTFSPMQIISVTDTTGPTLSGVPTSTSADCASVPVAATVTATDDCSGVNAAGVVLSETTTAGNCAGNYTIHRMWSATDNCGNSTFSPMQIISVTDTTGPTLSGVPASTSADCASVPAAATVTASDDCSGVNAAGVVLSETTTAGNCAGNYTIHRTWSATDNCGNTTISTTQNISVTDTTGPTLSGVPASTSADCASVPAAATVTATDDCSGVNAAGVVLSETTTAGNCAGNYTIHRMWSATDNCGNNTFSPMQIISVTDTTGPTLSGVPTSTSADCASVPAAATVTASDDCSGVNAAGVVLSETTTAGNCAGNYTIHRMWSATDNCGNNTFSPMQIISVTDTTGPTLSGVPASTSADCASVPAAATVTATDDCSGVNAAGVVLSETTTAGNCAGNYTIHRTWSATDNCGNTTISPTQNISVSDTTGPTIVCPGNITVAAGGNCCGTVNVTATVSDDCSGVRSVSYAPPLNSCFPIGTTTVTVNAEDNCGNLAAPCSFTVTVQGQICVTKFYDANANGSKDAGEPAISGWPMTLSDGQSGFTGLNGQVCFTVPTMGNYTVTEGSPTQNNWVASNGLSQPAVIDATHCNASVSFGNYCYAKPSNGFTIGYWSNKNGMTILLGHPEFAALLNGMGCLRNANGSLHTFTTPADLSNWLTGANATNMAYMLSAQLAATTLDVAYKGLSDTTNIIVPGGVKTLANVCIVPFVSISQSCTGGTPVLLNPTLIPGSTACGCASNNGVVTIGALRAKAIALLAAGTVTSAGTQRTYDECVKDLLDMINNNGNPTGGSAYPCGGVSQYVNPAGTCTPTF